MSTLCSTLQVHLENYDFLIYCTLISLFLVDLIAQLVENYIAITEVGIQTLFRPELFWSPVCSHRCLNAIDNCNDGVNLSYFFTLSLC